MLVDLCGSVAISCLANIARKGGGGGGVLPGNRLWHRWEPTEIWKLKNTTAEEGRWGAACKAMLCVARVWVTRDHWVLCFTQWEGVTWLNRPGEAASLMVASAEVCFLANSFARWTPARLTTLFMARRPLGYWSGELNWSNEYTQSFNSLFGYSCWLLVRTKSPLWRYDGLGWGGTKLTQQPAADAT